MYSLEPIYNYYTSIRNYKNLSDVRLVQILKGLKRLLKKDPYLVEYYVDIEDTIGDDGIRLNSGTITLILRRSLT